MKKANVKAVLLGNEQVDTLRQIQEQVRQQSPLGVAPSIHAIARGLVDKALADVPAFGFDLDNSEVAGMDKSVWSDK